MGRRSDKLLAAVGVVTPGDSPAPEDKDFINSIGKAFEVLRAFEQIGTRLGNQEIAERTGLPKSTVSRVTYTLARLGYLLYLPTDQKYKIGDSTVALSMSLLKGLDFRFLIRNQMRELAEYAEAAVGMSIRDQFDMVYLEHCRSMAHATIHRDFGTRIPLALTAAGRAYIASLRPEEQKEIFRQLEHHDRATWKRARADVLACIEEYKQRGFVTIFSGWHADLNGVAVPHWSRRHATTFVFNSGGPASVLTKARMVNEIGPRLRQLCANVSVLLDSMEDAAAVPMRR